MKPIIDIQEKLQEAVGKPKRTFSPPEKDAELVAKLTAEAESQLRWVLMRADNGGDIAQVKSLLVGVGRTQGRKSNL